MPAIVPRPGETPGLMPATLALRALAMKIVNGRGHFPVRFRPYRRHRTAPWREQSAFDIHVASGPFFV
ncbi:hypothetical protein BOSP111201_04680 [Bordetella sputigena]